jgi:hypothetical protein
MTGEEEREEMRRKLMIVKSIEDQNVSSHEAQGLSKDHRNLQDKTREITWEREREFANGRASRKVPPEDTVRGRGGTWRGLRRGRGWGILGLWSVTNASPLSSFDSPVRQCNEEA